MIHVSHLDFDFFEYLPQQNVLRGRRTKVTYEVGSRLKVVVVRVDEEKRRFDFAPSGEAKAVAQPKKSRAKGGKRGRKSSSGKRGNRSKADGNKKGNRGKKGKKKS
jgi:ribonuclease R